MKNSEKHECKRVSLRECVDFDVSHLLGAPFPVTLTGGVLEKTCEVCGAVAGHILTKPRQLVGMVAVLRSCDAKKLNGAEIRFLRKAMGLKANQLAVKLDIDPSYLSKIENDKQVMSVVHEKLLRSAVLFHYLEETRRLDMDGNEIFSMDIPAVVCASRTFELEMCLVEEGNILQMVGSEKAVHRMDKSWKDDCGAKVAV